MMRYGINHLSQTCFGIVELIADKAGALFDHSLTTTAGRTPSAAQMLALNRLTRAALRLTDAGSRLAHERIEECRRVAERDAAFTLWGATVGFALDATVDDDGLPRALNRDRRVYQYAAAAVEG